MWNNFPYMISFAKTTTPFRTSLLELDGQALLIRFALSICGATNGSTVSAHSCVLQGSFGLPKHNLATPKNSILAKRKRQAKNDVPCPSFCFVFASKNLKWLPLSVAPTLPAFAKVLLYHGLLCHWLSSHISVWSLCLYVPRYG